MSIKHPQQRDGIEHSAATDLDALRQTWISKRVQVDVYLRSGRCLPNWQGVVVAVTDQGVFEVLCPYWLGWRELRMREYREEELTVLDDQAEGSQGHPMRLMRVDIDGDGRLDLLVEVGGWTRIYWYTGTRLQLCLAA